MFLLCLWILCYEIEVEGMSTQKGVHSASAHHPSHRFELKQMHNQNNAKQPYDIKYVRSRREWVKNSIALWGFSSLSCRKVNASELEAEKKENFRSGGYGREEYSNAFTASRDTNISPKEAYDSIGSNYISFPVKNAQEMNRIPRALDVGAGAG